MQALDRKLVRNLWAMRSQALAIALVIACGVAMAVMSLSTLRSLDTARQVYYDRYRFADVFLSLTRAPLSVTQQLEQIPGVAAVAPRIVERVNLIVPGMTEPAVGQLISIPEEGEPVLNRLSLRRGRRPESGTELEALVGESFANAHGFVPGDSVEAILNGRLRELRIVGVVLSPEYIVEMNAADMLPDFRRFGLFWIPRDAMEAAFDMKGAFNDVTLSLMHGASEADVIRRLDLIADRWGSVGAYGRDDQMSHRFVSDEIAQLRAMGLVTPVIFMAVAGFLLNMVMARVIATQRVQIAALKAFGYRNREIGLHYARLVGAIVATGVLLGTGMGWRMGEGLTVLYTEFYKFPLFHFELDLQSTLLAAAFCLVSGILATWRALRSAVRLPPAEAMRPEPPGIFRRSVFERVGLLALLPQTGRMVVRQLQRRPLKALLSVAGIASAAAILVLGNYARDALDYLLEFQFRTVQRQDLWVNLVEETTIDVKTAFAHLPGVTRVETFRALPVRLRSGPRSRLVSVLGMESDRELYRILDESGREAALTDDGLILSDILGGLLDVQPGDTVTVEVLDGTRRVTTARVRGLVGDFSGTNAYALRPYVNRLAGEGPLVTGAWLSVDQDRLDTLYTELKHTPRVVGVAAREASIRSFMETVADNQLRIQSFVIGFACVIAAGVVYNTARIILSERDRELATLRVLGFTRGEVSAILLGELAVLTLAAIPPGLLMGYGMSWLTSLSLQTEMYRIPLIISPKTYVLAVVVVLASATVSGLVVRRRLDRLDLFAVLKGQE